MNQNSFDDLLTQYSTAMVLNPDPIIPAIKASKKYLENKLGMKELKKFIIDGKSE
ncbi:hypothetical protein [Candidatus Nitrosocosmicus sp. T]